MYNKIYRIVLHTDLGERIGKLKVSVTEGKLKGLLCLLSKETECTGTVDANGECKLSGTLKSLKNQVSYIATGYLRSSGLLLTLKCQTRSYKLDGSVSEA